MTEAFRISVPASTSNIGPGFDCLGLALDLRNDFNFRFDKPGLRVTAEGFGDQESENPADNLILRAFDHFRTVYHQDEIENIHVHCVNRVPMGSGLGSSSTAIVAGIMAANHAYGHPATNEDLLEIATAFEGHPDNVTPAIFGGFTASMMTETSVKMKHFPIANWQISLVVPRFHVSTAMARKALPQMVPLGDAVFNMNHVIFLMRALAEGDEPGLALAMEDRLHQRFRMELIPGSGAIIDAAIQAGACASGLSGSGPGIIAFTMDREKTSGILDAMHRAALAAGHEAADAFTVAISNQGAQIQDL